MSDKYPIYIFATERFGSNNIKCLDYRNYDSDVEYIRKDVFNRQIEQLKKENESLKYSVTYESEHKQVYFDQMQDLKCCANCTHFNSVNDKCFIDDKKPVLKWSYNFCRKWIFDGLTQKEREV